MCDCTKIPCNADFANHKCYSACCAIKAAVVEGVTGSTAQGRSGDVEPAEDFHAVQKDFFKSEARAGAMERDFSYAIQSFQDGISEDASDPELFIDLADVHRENLQLDEARRTLARFEELQPNQAEKFHFNRVMAGIEYDSGQYEEAIQRLKPWRDALKPRPEDDGVAILAAYYLDIIYTTARSYEKLGQHKTACTYWTEFQSVRQSIPPDETLILWFADKLTVAYKAFKACHSSDNNE